ncbi:uncharacterized protein LOC110457221 [Mizuhopecten yessoensis]|uniref:uncharacterized protein LOC110457221 n=1 Tax=Mizuhopecten yessoensis TaxID=6573 RepID=UPI000B45CDCD|nr:uncharacterized protein LOC110457221 [Mizuhopecten yessoensis]
MAVQLPVKHTIVALYVAHAHNLKFANSTIASHLSAIAYWHSLHGFADPTKSFLVRKAIRGAASLAPTYDIRLPITLPILERLCSAVPTILNNVVQQNLVVAVFAVAFYSLARIGELLGHCSLGTSPKKVVQLDDVTFEADGAVLKRMHITYREFKHNISGKPHVIPVEANTTSNTCPVTSLYNYIKMRGSSPGALFIDELGQPFPRARSESITRRCLVFCDLDVARYKGHSFRIGGASYAAAKGFTDAQIRLLGRWKTDAFKRYIRSPSL